MRKALLIMLVSVALIGVFSVRTEALTVENIWAAVGVQQQLAAVAGAPAAGAFRAIEFAQELETRFTDLRGLQSDITSGGEGVVGILQKHGITLSSGQESSLISAISALRLLPRTTRSVDADTFAETIRTTLDDPFLRTDEEKGTELEGLLKTTLGLRDEDISGEAGEERMWETLCSVLERRAKEDPDEYKAAADRIEALRTALGK